MPPHVAPRNARTARRPSNARPPTDPPSDPESPTAGGLSSSASSSSMTSASSSSVVAPSSSSSTASIRGKRRAPQPSSDSEDSQYSSPVSSPPPKAIKVEGGALARRTKTQLALTDSSDVKIPAFLDKLYRMLSENKFQHLMTWNQNGTTFLVLKPEGFAREVLPKYFKHSNFSSFVRQLNMYGFKKVPHTHQGVLQPEEDQDAWEFVNPNFMRDKPDMLIHVKRKNSEPRASGTSSDVKKAIQGIDQIRQQQALLSESIKLLRSENKSLWDQVASTQERYERQRKLTDRIMQFLIIYTKMGHHPAAPLSTNRLLTSGRGDGPDALPHLIFKEASNAMHAAGPGAAAVHPGTFVAGQNPLPLLQSMASNFVTTPGLGASGSPLLPAFASSLQPSRSMDLFSSLRGGSGTPEPSPGPTTSSIIPRTLSSGGISALGSGTGPNPSEDMYAPMSLAPSSTTYGHYATGGPGGGPNGPGAGIYANPSPPHLSFGAGVHTGRQLSAGSTGPGAGAPGYDAGVGPGSGGAPDGAFHQSATPFTYFQGADGGHSPGAGGATAMGSMGPGGPRASSTSYSDGAVISDITAPSGPGDTGDYIGQPDAGHHYNYGSPNGGTYHNSHVTTPHVGAGVGPGGHGHHTSHGPPSHHGPLPPHHGLSQPHHGHHGPPASHYGHHDPPPSVHHTNGHPHHGSYGTRGLPPPGAGFSVNAGGHADMYASQQQPQPQPQSQSQVQELPSAPGQSGTPGGGVASTAPTPVASSSSGASSAVTSPTLSTHHASELPQLANDAVQAATLSPSAAQQPSQPSQSPYYPLVEAHPHAILSHHSPGGASTPVPGPGVIIVSDSDAPLPSLSHHTRGHPHSDLHFPLSHSPPDFSTGHVAVGITPSGPVHPLVDSLSTDRLLLPPSHGDDVSGSFAGFPQTEEIFLKSEDNIRSINSRLDTIQAEIDSLQQDVPSDGEL
ncbi:hypothetical protein H696_03200 [Fonticula alba]|uniref:HSF-type DNA-binding domain-containing protein n=1 Tax=Fonticula alba TaxID=691883 RepID=A0A058ZA71_FONAL|nr:hypothetical protein H696_03200 [Fonticula alba]KCV70843.1 hypothetical protein H696_03200 [Fonticula alba]|eukprot:XP_009495359.1 hypothetical protein H696_03200 [Fonticula alba]